MRVLETAPCGLANLGLPIEFFADHKFEVVDRDQIAVEFSASRLVGVWDDPSNGIVLLSDDLPIIVRCFDAMRFEEEIVMRIESIDHSSDDGEFLQLPVAFDDLLSSTP